MNKNVIFKLLCAAVAVVILMVSLSSCGAPKVKDASFYADYSHPQSISFVNKDGENVNGVLNGVDGDFFDISFNEPCIVDTLVIKEKGDNVTEFEIYAKNNDEFELLYRQDLIGAMRYCAFADTVTDTLRVKVTKSVNGEFSLNSIDVFNSQHTQDDFKITSYVIADRVYDINSLDAKHFNVITDVILFGAVDFDENGNLIYKDCEINGQTISGDKVLEMAINNINAVSENKSIKFYINLLGPSGADDDEKQELHTKCFKNSSEALIGNINEMLGRFGVDGVYFDYEYPYKQKHMNAFSDFLVELDAKLADGKKIGLALAPWGNAISDKAKEAVDFGEIMAYDLFDDNGYHATFASIGGAFSIDYFNKKGYDLTKCHLGVPFYSRPVDRDGVWLDYKSAAETLGKFGNVDSTTVNVDNDRQNYSVARYYNSYQMVFDKTAFAYDYGVGGMMVWHYSCDVPADTGLSLFDAMAKAIESRQK